MGNTLTIPFTVVVVVVLIVCCLRLERYKKLVIKTWVVFMAFIVLDGDLKYTIHDLCDSVIESMLGVLSLILDSYSRVIFELQTICF